MDSHFKRNTEADFLSEEDLQGRSEVEASARGKIVVEDQVVKPARVEGCQIGFSWQRAP